MTNFKNKKDLENENRLENIKELLSAMKEFDNLESFLEHVALATSIDQDWEGEKINLMTMHGSKGLEFDVVFLPGWEEGLFPHQKSLEEKGNLALEEERRLAYVGLTRAKKESFISFVMSRMYRGDWVDSLASRFIDELPEENIKKEEIKEGNAYVFFGNYPVKKEEEMGEMRYIAPKGLSEIAQVCMLFNNFSRQLNNNGKFTSQLGFLVVVAFFAGVFFCFL